MKNVQEAKVLLHGCGRQRVVGAPKYTLPHRVIPSIRNLYTIPARPEPRV